MYEFYQDEEITSNYFNKYTYNIEEQDPDLFIFELKLNKFDEHTKTIRKIQRTKSGNLISIGDNINYDEIKKVNLTAIDINSPDKELEIDFDVNHLTDKTNFPNNEACGDPALLNNFMIGFLFFENKYILYII
jgi:hypothetical protein